MHLAELEQVRMEVSQSNDGVLVGKVDAFREHVLKHLELQVYNKNQLPWDLKGVLQKKETNEETNQQTKKQTNEKKEAFVRMIFRSRNSYTLFDKLNLGFLNQKV